MRLRMPMTAGTCSQLLLQAPQELHQTAINCGQLWEQDTFMNKTPFLHPMTHPLLLLVLLVAVGLLIPLMCCTCATSALKLCGSHMASSANILRLSWIFS